MPQLRECKHPLFDLLELYFKKEYVCKIPLGEIKTFLGISYLKTKSLPIYYIR